jgi:hypothetical protein
VAVSDDGTYVLLAGDENAARPTHALRIDNRLHAAIRNELDDDDERRESELSPKEIQARLRAGDSVEAVARDAKVALARVQRYAGPVISERERVIDQARAAVLQRSRGPQLSTPLGEVVDRRLAETAGLKPDSVEWSARRRDDGAWVVSVSYRARGGARIASWLWAPAERELTSLGALGTRVGADEAPAARRRSAAAGSAATPTARRRTAKRTTARRGPAKHSAAKRAPAKGAPAKRAPAKRAPAKRASANRSAAARTAAKRTPAERPAATRATSKPAPVKSAPAKRAPAKGTAVAIRTTRSAATRAPAPKKRAATKRSPAKRTPATQATSRAAAKAATTRTPPGGPPAKATARRSTAAGRGATKRSAPAAAARRRQPPSEPVAASTHPATTKRRQARPAETPVIEPTTRRTNGRASLPSWSDVLIGVQTPSVARGRRRS